MEERDHHKLENSWVYWAHSPKNTDWSINGYIKIGSFDSVEGLLSIHDSPPKELADYCMLFVMKEGIQPIWEDPRNVGGGAYSYKIKSARVREVWEDLIFLVCGATLNSSPECITGISVSPKRNFNILKIWTTSESVDVSAFNPGPPSKFRAHKP